MIIYADEQRPRAQLIHGPRLLPRPKSLIHHGQLDVKVPAKHHQLAAKPSQNLEHLVFVQAGPSISPYNSEFEEAGGQPIRFYLK